MHGKQLYAALGSTPAEEAATPSTELQPEDEEDNKREATTFVVS